MARVRVKTSSNNFTPLADACQFAFLLAVVALQSTSGCGARSGLGDDHLSELDSGVIGADAVPDAAPRPPECFEVAFAPNVIEVALSTSANVGSGDIVFLIDVTGSMSSVIEAFQQRLADTIVPAIAEQIPDVELGVATFADFPVHPYGDDVDLPFGVVHPVTEDVAAVSDAVVEMFLLSGNDLAESQVEALYQLATGEGLDPWIAPAGGCSPGRSGFMCIREDALPIVVMVTDAPFHDGPTGGWPYDLPVPTHTWPEAVDALSRLGARFIGLDAAPEAEEGGSTDMSATGEALGTIDLDGNPLVFTMEHEESQVVSSIVDAMQTLSESVRFDVDAIAEDLPGDDVDGAALVSFIRPTSATPPSGVEEIAESAFRGVVPGTQLTFTLGLRNESIAPRTEPLLVPIEIVFRIDGHATARRVRVDLVVPATDGDSCPDE